MNTDMTLILHRLLLDHPYAIVDRMRAEILPEGMTLHPLVPSRLEGSSRLLPALVDLSQLKPALFAACLERLHKEGGSDASLCSGLLQCDAEFSSLREALRSALIAEFAGEDRYFRYFDPRVFCQLERILEPAQYCRIFGNAASWVYPLDGEWHQAYRPDIAPVLRLRFSALQTDQLDQLLMTNQLIENLPLSPTLSRPRAQLGREVYALILAARQHGLKRQRDISLFVEHGLTLHREFYRHEVIAARLATLDQNLDFPYTYAVLNLSQDDVHRVRMEMNES